MHLPQDHIPIETSLVIVCVACLWWLGFVTLFGCAVEEPPTTDTEEGSTEEGGEGIVARIGFTLRGEEMQATRRFLLASFLISEARCAPAPASG